jgi:hypothetical protein
LCKKCQQPGPVNHGILALSLHVMFLWSPTLTPYATSAHAAPKNRMNIGHYLSDCPLNKCFKCGGNGHIASFCPQPR